MLTAGLVIRVAVLSFPGTGDLDQFRTWSYVATTDGPGTVYGHGFPARHILMFGDNEGIANYPPLAIEELAVIGHIYRFANGGMFPDSPALTMTLRGAIVLADAAMAALIFVAVRKLGGARAAWWGASAYWMSPAVLLATTLGYIDVFFAVPAVGAVVAAASGRSVVAGALFGAAVMTKPQALFVGPAIALALWNTGDAEQARRRLLVATKSAAILAAIVTLPVVFAGTILNMLRSLGSMLRHDMLSGNACNLWWIVGYVIQVVDAAHRGDPTPARTVADIVPISSLPDVWYVSPRMVGAALACAATVWALGIARGARERALFAALAAFVVHAYFTLSAQVHENHFFVAMPLLILAAALRREFTPIAAALSLVFALNLYLFYGVDGGDAPEIARTLTIVDSTLLLSVVNCAVLAWFAMVFRRACQSTSTDQGEIDRAVTPTSDSMLSRRTIADSGF